VELTVLGEAAAQIDDEVKGRFHDVGWEQQRAFVLAQLEADGDV